MVSTDNKTNKISKDFIEMRGIITELLPACSFRIKLENNQEIIGFLSGKMRMNKIRLAPGDEVKIELTPYDLSKGRITFRY
jgi:translation initiation factor IF-1